MVHSTLTAVKCEKSKSPKSCVTSQAYNNDTWWCQAVSCSQILYILVSLNKVQSAEGLEAAVLPPKLHAAARRHRDSWERKDITEHREIGVQAETTLWNNYSYIPSCKSDYKALSPRDLMCPRQGVKLEMVMTSNRRPMNMQNLMENLSDSLVNVYIFPGQFLVSNCVCLRLDSFTVCWPLRWPLHLLVLM